MGNHIDLLTGDLELTPLHDACASGNCDTLQLLMEAGASVIAQDVNVSAIVLCLP